MLAKSSGETARKQGGPCRRTHGTNIVLIELQTGFCESIQVWGPNCGSVPADICPAEIVGYDKEDVWLLSSIHFGWVSVSTETIGV